MMSDRKGQNGREPKRHAIDAITNEPWQVFSVCGIYSQRLTADPKLVNCGNCLRKLAKTGANVLRA